MSLFLTLSLTLIIAHIVSDFYLQPAAWREDKALLTYRSPKLALHSLMHALLASIPVLFVTQHFYSIICLLLIAAISHWLIELAKITKENLNASKIRLFFTVQAMHLIVLVVISWHVSGVGFTFLDSLSELNTPKNLAIVLAYILIFKPTSILIGIVLQKYAPQSTTDNEGLRSGGEMIGYLERLLMLTFIIIGQYAVVGFILAAKSIFRFGELNNAKNHNLTEYVLLGSLTSVTISSMLGIFVKLYS